MNAQKSGPLPGVIKFMYLVPSRFAFADILFSITFLVAAMWSFWRVMTFWGMGMGVGGLECGRWEMGLAF